MPLLGCGRIGYRLLDTHSDGSINKGDSSLLDDASTDAGLQNVPRLCNNWGTFGLASAVSELNTTDLDFPASISPDGLRFYISSGGFPQTSGIANLYATRANTSSPWTNVTRIAEIDSANSEFDFWVWPSGLSAFFTREIGNGTYRTFLTTRLSLTEPWSSTSTPSTFDQANASTAGLVISRAEDEIYGWSDRNDIGTQSDIFRWRRNLDGSYGPPEALPAPVSTTSDEQLASISADGLELFGYINGNIWRATRPALDQAWNVRETLAPATGAVNQSPTIEENPVISPDGTVLYFASNRGANFDIYTATRSCND